MFLKYSFVLRILFKAAIMVALAYIVQTLSQKLSLFDQNWYYVVLAAIGFAFIEDKIAIERKHTLIFLPIKSDLSAFEWLENHNFKLMRKKRNRRIYVERADTWYIRNEFVRITLMENKLKLKMNNALAREFELDFIAVVQDSIA